MYPGTVWCTQMLLNCNTSKKGRINIAINIRTSTTAAKVILLVKLRFLFPLLRAIRCPRHETGSGKKKRQSNYKINGEWQGKTARACIGSHTFLIDGSWLLPTKRLFRSDANFDFHDNRPKMADLKSVYNTCHSRYNVIRYNVKTVITYAAAVRSPEIRIDVT